MKRLAFYVQDTGDPEDTADHQMERLLAETAGEDALVVREYVDYRNLGLYRMLGEATQRSRPSTSSWSRTRRSWETRRMRCEKKARGKRGHPGQSGGRQPRACHLTR